MGYLTIAAMIAVTMVHFSDFSVLDVLKFWFAFVVGTSFLANGLGLDTLALAFGAFIAFSYWLSALFLINPASSY